MSRGAAGSVRLSDRDGRSPAQPVDHQSARARHGIRRPLKPSRGLCQGSDLRKRESGGQACYPRGRREGYKTDDLQVGETVVYPDHGAAYRGDGDPGVKGEERLYLVSKVAQGDLTVRVPAENRVWSASATSSARRAGRVFEVLRAPHTEEPTNWSRRYKANLEKLASGDVIKVAEVVRDLWRRERDRGLSAGEKRMLAKARQILVSELALAEHTNEDKAETILDEVLAS